MPSAPSSPAIVSDTAGCYIPSGPAALAMLPQWTTLDRMSRSRSFSRRPIWLCRLALGVASDFLIALAEDSGFSL
jgi:hypothetical protein